MKVPVNTLTEDQAVAELAEIMDSRPADEEVLAVHHWQRDNAVRAQQLEAHIVHLQHLAPPQQLPPDPPPAPAATKEIPVSPKKTPQEKLDHLLRAFGSAMVLVHGAPGNRAFRDKVNTLRSNIRQLCRDEDLLEPKLQAMPDLPDPKPKGIARPAPEPPGAPYVPPTAEDIRALLPTPSTPTHAKAVYPAHQVIRGIRRNFWDLLSALEDISDREGFRADLELIAAQAEQALRLVDETAAKAS